LKKAPKKFKRGAKIFGAKISEKIKFKKKNENKKSAPKFQNNPNFLRICFLQNTSC